MGSGMLYYCLYMSIFYLKGYLSNVRLNQETEVLL